MSTDTHQQIERIIEAMGVDRSQVFGRTRIREDVWPRHLCWWALVVVLGHSKTHVARLWNVDRSSVTSGVRDVQDAIDTNKRAAQDAAEIREKIK
jgi:chromosomal replication initiation ATPase DnaA